MDVTYLEMVVDVDIEGIGIEFVEVLEVVVLGPLEILLVLGYLA